MGKILIGTAGWSYEDWRGRVYPAGAGSRFDPLAYLAEYFDLVEVNSTFYRLPDPQIAHSWLARTRARPGFIFLLKAPQDWTHGDKAPTPESLDRFRALASILADAGRLGSLLLQFPWSFRNDSFRRERIARLVALLEDLPVAVEVRHAGYEHKEWLAWLRSLDCTPVNIDQPLLDKSLPLSAEVGETRAYFRFHGRNEGAWFDPKAGRDQRYDYLYDEGELTALGDEVQRAAEISGTVLVVTNNHFLGQAAVNALQLKFRFAGGPLAVPPALLRHYPQLEKIALPLDEEQGELF